MSQSIGGQRPTNSARRSAFPRSLWSCVFALIQSPMHRTTEPIEARCRCQPRRPAVWTRLTRMIRLIARSLVS